MSCFDICWDGNPKLPEQDFSCFFTNGYSEYQISKMFEKGVLR